MIISRAMVVFQLWTKMILPQAMVVFKSPFHFKSFCFGDVLMTLAFTLHTSRVFLYKFLSIDLYERHRLAGIILKHASTKIIYVYHFHALSQ